MQNAAHAPPQMLIGKAMNYLDHQWAQLIRVLDDGRLEVARRLRTIATMRVLGLGRR
jgi:hypothetical protein